MKNLLVFISKSKLFSGKSKTRLFFLLLFFMSSLQAFSSLTIYSVSRSNNTAGLTATYTFQYSCALDYSGQSFMIFAIQDSELNFTNVAGFTVYIDGAVVGVQTSMAWWKDAMDGGGVYRGLSIQYYGDIRGKTIKVELYSVTNGPAGYSSVDLMGY